MYKIYDRYRLKLALNSIILTILTIGFANATGRFITITGGMDQFGLPLTIRMQLTDSIGDVIQDSIFTGHGDGDNFIDVYNLHGTYNLNIQSWDSCDHDLRQRVIGFIMFEVNNGTFKIVHYLSGRDNSQINSYDKIILNEIVEDDLNFKIYRFYDDDYEQCE